MTAKVYLKKNREASILRFHPWVFSGAVANVTGSPAEGDIVGVFSSEGEFLASGHWQIGSISVRILSFAGDPEAPDFWKNALGAALQARIAAGLAQGGVAALCAGDSPATRGRATTCYRLVHGEGDGLPGLIIDWYDGVAVMQAHSAGMFRAKHQICEALKAVYGGSLQAVYDKSSGTAPFKAGLDLVDGYLYKAEGFVEGPRTVLENGHKFLVDWTEGQKTGFFLDQRENRALVEKYSRGRRVLNLFCYTGGFSVYALGGGAVRVDSVDSSAKAIALAGKNLELGGFAPDRHSEICADVKDYLGTMVPDAYDLIIVDPPAFAKHRGALDRALRAYQRLNAAAISAVAPGGFVFTFSCSQVVDRQTFLETIFSAAAQTGRRVRILDRLNQPADHAVSIYHPEGEYLKGLLLYVE